jgi:hypothetical protein
MCITDGGSFFEATTLGKCKLPCDNKYLPRPKAMDLVRKHQPSTKPNAVCKLVQEVAKLVKVQVQFFTAVGSVLDEFHSIDGFFLFGEIDVTIDLTKNTRKCSGRADLIVREEDFENIAQLAASIVSEYKAKSRNVCGAKPSNRSGTADNIRVWRAA